MKRKLLAILTSVVLLCASIPLGVVSVSAATSGTTGDCTWTLNGTVLTISGNGAMEDRYNYKPWGSSITSVVIEDGVTTIGAQAFYYCTRLTTVVIGDDVTVIGDEAFYYCYNLTSLTIGDSVATIGDEAFYYCDELTSLSLPDSVITIGYSAFSKCYGLTEVTIPDSVTTIGDSAFYNCENLQTVTIGAGVSDIGVGAFSYCPLLTAIDADEDNPYYTSVDGVLFNEDMTTIVDCPENKSGVYRIPDGVTTIGNNVFFHCANLTEVVSPQSVTAIGIGAFHSCTSLTAVNIPDGVTSIEDSTFGWCEKLSSITIPNRVTAIGKYAFCGCTSLTEVTIPDRVSTIGEYAFAGCSSLTAINVSSRNGYYRSKDGVLFDRYMNTLIQYPVAKTGTAYRIPDGTVAIAAEAFARCSALTAVFIPDSVTTIGVNAFGDCTSLTSLTIPDSVVTIGGGAFQYCTALTTLTLGDSVTTIGNYAFFNCDSLTSLIIPDSVTTIGEYAFSSCYSLTSVTIPDSVTTVGEYAFGGCYSLAAVYISDIATWLTIDFGWFESSCNLYLNGELVTDLVIPDGVTTIKSGMFFGCFDTVTIPASVYDIGRNNFGNCAVYVDEDNPYYSSVDGVLFSKDKTILYHCPFGRYVIPDGVTTICEGAFKPNWYLGYELSFVAIPDTVTYIGESAFESAYDLTIYYAGSEQEWAENVYVDYYNYGLSDATWIYGESDAADAAVGLEYRIDGGCVTITGYDYDTLPAILNIPPTIEGYPVTTIAEQAFYRCENLTMLTIPDSVTTIGYGAFSWCENLVIATIGDGVTALPSSVFSNCRSLSMVEMGDNVTSIGEYAFEFCPLISITLPTGVSHIGYNALGGYDNRVGAIHVQPGNPYYASVDGVLFNSDKTTLLQYPGGKRGAYTIPAGATTVGEYAFYGCTSLTSVTIPDSVTTIGYSAFDYCYNLTSVTIGNGVTAIEQWAFNGCENLTSVNLPKSVTTIGPGAFDYALTDVYYGGTEEDRANIFIKSPNRELLNATWHYYCDGHVYDNDCDPDCNKCGEERKDLGHVYDGICDPDCNECGAVRDVPDHWYELVYDCDPTCGMEGFAEYICVYCGHFYSDITPATGNHTYDHECDRDCNTCGFTREVGDHFYDTACDADCVFCGYVREVGDHVYDDEYDADCNECGETREVPERPIVFGDANGDGAVNARDVALLQQYIAGWDALMDEMGADANGDGEINARDAALLQQYLAGWDVTLGE